MVRKQTLFFIPTLFLGIFFFVVPCGVLAASTIYVIGGQNAGDGILDVNEAYDPASNTWSTKASMP
ncbi:MAG: kelch repeat-containing protein, partial [Patescibacteria group bacterium]